MYRSESLSSISFLRRESRYFSASPICRQPVTTPWLMNKYDCTRTALLLIYLLQILVRGPCTVKFFLKARDFGLELFRLPISVKTPSKLKCESGNRFELLRGL